MISVNLNDNKLKEELIRIQEEYKEKMREKPRILLTKIRRKYKKLYIYIYIGVRKQNTNERKKRRKAEKRKNK